MKKHLIKIAILALMPLTWSTAHSTEAIKLTQTGCQFLEPEAIDNQFTTNQADDCLAINKKSGANRLATSKTIHLKPGGYIFRVTNNNVPYPSGFWLQDEGLGHLTLPSVSGDGIETGQSSDDAIKLKA